MAESAHDPAVFDHDRSQKTTGEFIANINKQQLAAANLQKEFKKYSLNMKAMSTTTKALLEWMEKYYEPQWAGRDEVLDIVKSKMILWKELINMVNDDLIESLQLYMSKFPDAMKLVKKQKRVDMDYAKTLHEKACSKQTVTDVKKRKTEDACLKTKQAFDEVTDKFHKELPALYDSRIEFYSKLFTSMSTVEAKFHEKMLKLDSRYNEIMCGLLQEAQSGKQISKKETVTDIFASLTHQEPKGASPKESEIKECSDRIDECVRHYDYQKPQGMIFIVGMFGAAGTDIDVDHVRSTFEHPDIRFAILPIQSPTSDELTALVAAASKYKYPWSYKFIAFYFSGHGGTDKDGKPFVQTLSEGRVFIEQSIIEPFQNITRIRLFFFDCCLSQPTSVGARSVDTGRRGSTSIAPPIIKSNRPQGEVVAYAVSKGQKAYGDQGEGGEWTRLLCKNIMAAEPLLLLLAKTNREVRGQKPLTASNVDDTVIISNQHNTAEED